MEIFRKHKGKLLAVVFAAGMSACMKTSMVSAAGSGVVLNHQNFPDDALREAVADFDLDGDGRLQKKEVKKAESLRITKFLDPDDVDLEDHPDAVVPNYKKSDFVFNLKGVGYFTNLKELVINLGGGVVKKTGKHYASVIQNLDQVYTLKNLENFGLISAKVKKMDLSKLPKLQKTELYLCGVQSVIIKNKELKKIDFHDESDTSKLQYLDFSNAPKLKTVSAYRLQGAELMFGEKNRRLKTLYAAGNEKTQITSMDLTKLTGLETLEMSWLKIKTLDFSKNKNLTTVLFDRCSVKTLDFSNNKKLIDVGCEGKKTKEIILPDKNKIKYFRWSNAGLSEFSMKQLNPNTLTILKLTDNSIQSLNLKKYKKLEYVYVDKNVEVTLPASLSEDVVYRW